LDKYNKDHMSEDGKVKILWIILQIKNTGKNKKNEEVNKIKFTADKEIILLPYFIGGENKEKKYEDRTENCLTINKLMIHSFYSEIILSESFWIKLKLLNKKMKLIIYNFFSYLYYIK
jgi:hypothetical protein